MKTTTYLVYKCKLCSKIFKIPYPLDNNFPIQTSRTHLRGCLENSEGIADLIGYERISHNENNENNPKGEHNE